MHVKIKTLIPYERLGTQGHIPAVVLYIRSLRSKALREEGAGFIHVTFCKFLEVSKH